MSGDSHRRSEADIKSDLPVFEFAEQLTNLVDTNQVTIITAETGAGKSTQIPQYLAAHGYTKVVVTQPRILAARNLSKRVREEWLERGGLAEEVGYRTANERDDAPDSKILYCTDGLQLVREITGSGVEDRQVLVLDEVHEWNENMEVLVAWAKLRCQEDSRFKVVIMSATIETGSLAEYFDTEAVVNIPGRSHEVTKKRGADVIAEIYNYIEKSSNMLVFLPGKAEITDVAETIKLKAEAAGVPIIPLHSQLEATAQQQAFANYPNGKIILATNIAQTSVTIDDIDVVIDSGLARQSEVRNGVEGLFIVQTSQADCLQRAGRAGRTKAGEYVLAQYGTMECLDFEERPEYATPEILRKHIDRLTLRLASVGIDIATLDFYHDPSHKAIMRAKRTLVALGALSKNGDITRVGRQMETFPVESNYGRMLVESKRYGQAIQTKLTAIIGIQEIGGILKGGSRYTGWRRLTRQTKSDLLAEYEVFLAIDNRSNEELEELGIVSKNVAKAHDVHERLARDLSLSETNLEPITKDEEDQLLRCIVAGQIDQLWTIDDHGEATHITTKTHRELSSSTIVRNPKLVTGTPFDLQVPTHSGGLETLHLLQDITRVNTMWLLDLAPHLFAPRRGKAYYDPRSGHLATRQLVRFGGQVLEGTSEPITDNTPPNRRLFNEAYSAWAYEQLERERRELGRFHTKQIPSIPRHVIETQVKSIADDIVSLDEATSAQRRELTDLSHLATHLGEHYMSQIGKSFRSRQPHHKSNHARGWKPQHKRKYDRRQHR